MAAGEIAVGVGALINGIASERMIDPDSISDELFGLIASRLIVGMLSPPTDPPVRRASP